MTAALSRVPRAVADLNVGTILASVDIAASPERVFAALTSDEITKWWGSADTYRTTGWNADLRVGGHWRADGKGQDGRAFVVQGEFLVIDPPRRLVQTWRPDWDPGAPTTVTYDLMALDGGTRVTIRHEGFADRSESCSAHASGWEGVLGWLGAHLAPKTPEARFFLCRLLGPRPTFPADMTPEEGAIMAEHAAYWTKHLQAGSAIAFGPVLDPKGVWGLGLVRVADESAVRAMEANDPAITSGRGFRYEILPMMSAVVRG